MSWVVKQPAGSTVIITAATAKAGKIHLDVVLDESVA
jgi:hypothetical protein